MKKTVLLLSFALMSPPWSQAATRYVDMNNATPAPPYISWETAATNIQDAMDVTSNGDTVLVSNGVYNTGGRVGPGSMLTNRVVVTNEVALRSVNGPAFTTIAGAKGAIFTNDDASVRAVWLGSGSSLYGFTISGGSTRGEGGETETRGGGIYTDVISLITNCIISGNSARSGGGGAYGGVFQGCWFYNNDCLSGLGLGGGVDSAVSVRDCFFEGNSGSSGGAVSRSNVESTTMIGNTSTFGGGAVYQSTVLSSLIISNSGMRGGGARESILTNCVVRHNFGSLEGGGLYDSLAYNCTIVSNTAQTGGGIDESDVINSIVYYNVSGSGGDNYTDSTFSFSCTTPLPGFGPGNIANSPNFVDKDNDDLRLAAGSKCINRGMNANNLTSEDLDGNPRIAFQTVDMGAYEYQTQEPSGTVHYVREGHTGDAFPYTSWEIAAPDIQTAVDAAAAGSTVLVTNGVYDEGGRIAHDGVISNRVVIDKAVRVESVTGPANTIIIGSGPIGLSAVRCVWMTNGASLSGFAILSGATSGNSFSGGRNGGGVWAQSASAVISNCSFTANEAFKKGGGVYGGTVYNSSLNLNTAEDGGGASESTLWHCTLTQNDASSTGGGVQGGSLFSCLVYTNKASVLGGGVASSYAENCLILENRCDFFGGGASFGQLVNCTVVGNSAAENGGVYLSNNRNTIIYHNTAPVNPNFADGGDYQNVCTYPLPFISANTFTNDPQLVSLGSGALSAGSPCRDTGNASYIAAAFDRLGNPRVVNGYVDIGAQEFQGAGQADFDGDGNGNGDEGVAGTDFTDANNVFGVADVASGGITFDSVSGREYALDYNEDLLAVPQVWTEFTNNISGTGSPLTINDPDDATKRNYRVRVRLE